MKNCTINRNMTISEDMLYKILTRTSYVFVISSVAMHVAYLLLAAFVRDLRILIFINHAILANSFYPLSCLIFSFVDPNTISNVQIVRVLCSFFEIFWPFSIYSRMYAILLIAIHRYLAVFKPDLFKRMNASTLFQATPILIVWSISISLSLICKHVFSTTYSLTNCLNGFSQVWVKSLLQALFFISFSLLIPSVGIISLYAIIARKLRRVVRNLHSFKKKQPERHPNRTNRAVVASFFPNTRRLVSSTRRLSRQREMNCANQFIMMCLTVVLANFAIATSNLRGVIPNYFTIMFYWRPVLRCLIMIMSAMLPILSVYYKRRKLLTLAAKHNSYFSRLITTDKVYHNLHKC